MLPPAITSLMSLQTFKRALKTERYCSPEVLFPTCVAMKFVDDDDDDDGMCRLILYLKSVSYRFHSS